VKVNMSSLCLCATMEVYRGSGNKAHSSRCLWSGDFTRGNETMVFIDILASV